jgi:hypothetical protein
MDIVKKYNNEIRRLEYIQTKGLSKSAHRQVVWDLSRAVIKKNDAVAKAKQEEIRKESYDRNFDIAHDIFSAAKGRKVLGPPV